MADADEDDDDFSISDMALDHAFLAELEDFTMADSDDYISGHFSGDVTIAF